MRAPQVVTPARALSLPSTIPTKRRPYPTSHRQQHMKLEQSKTYQSQPRRSPDHASAAGRDSSTSPLPPFDNPNEKASLPYVPSPATYETRTKQNLSIPAAPL